MVPIAPPLPGCPPGLQYLAMVDQLEVKQEVEILEVATGFEMGNKYKVFNALGQQVYYAREIDPAFSMSPLIGPFRACKLTILMP